MARQASYDRDKVLKSAMDLFWAKGFHATSLKDLEQALDMRPGSIYAAFGSKEGLFAEALRLYSGQSQGGLSEVLAGGGSRLGALANYVRQLGGQNRGEVPSRACMLVKTILEMPDDDPSLRGLAEELIDRMELTLTEVLRAAQAEGELPAEADPARLAARLQTELIGLRAYAQRINTEDRVAQVAEDIARGIEALSWRAA
ncbi:TetR/AcrR family transcriptional regulator [Celeribacter neptunius]|uniref:Transcriptional regulator, TetR family n=1 Tax=Celeribacter neptunius TaxID=588602 RepID=A0A1I3QSM2_9RHOB|nr:TetR/AcrR family transcriptional regulator [Celeribacter neptunius]SFJ36462.1 transcriptional regulator, TetR family [Celeribacter neptunius]